MERTVVVSEELYTALQRQASRSQVPVDELVENWLTQHLDLGRYPELEWRQGPGGWRVGIRGQVIDVYTIVGYVRAGYAPQAIARDLLPRLTPQQIAAALRYYAEFPAEVDKILEEATPEAAKAQLQRALGPAAYRRLTGAAAPTQTLHENSPEYNSGRDAD